MSKNCLKASNYRLTSRPSRLGFTLIEILVVISIIGILFGIGLVQYRHYNRRQLFQQAVGEVRSSLRLAQDKALSGARPQGMFWCDVPGEALKGYRFSFPSQTTYQIDAVCTSDESVYLVKGPEELPGEGEIQGFGGPVLFKVLGQGTDASAGETIDLTLTGFGQTEEIKISSTGEIE